MAVLFELWHELALPILIRTFKGDLPLAGQISHAVSHSMLLIREFGPTNHTNLSNHVPNHDLFYDHVRVLFHVAKR